MSHTPGPWVMLGTIPTGAADPGVPKTMGDPDVFEIKAQPSVFMRGFTMSIATAYGEPEARLIAAAPDLYSALQAVMLEFGPGTMSDDAFRNATAALEKARGEQKE